MDLNWQEVGESKKLQTHWAEQIQGGDCKGDELAEVWEKGKQATRVCLGVFVCDNGRCGRVTRPKIDPAQLNAQKQVVCEYQASLVYQACGNIARISGNRAQHVGCQIVRSFRVLVVLIKVLCVRVEPPSKL